MICSGSDVIAFGKLRKEARTKIGLLDHKKTECNLVKIT